MKKYKKYIEHPRVLPAAFIAVILFSVTCRLSAVTLEGNPFTPSGADYQIFAMQEVEPSNPNDGGADVHPQVNTNFEFTPSIGVSYDTGGGKLTNFGIGLYLNSNGDTDSTGLKIQYTSLVDAASVTITVEDFDLKSNKSTFFNPQKVEPSLMLLGSGGKVYANLTPTQIFPYLTPNSSGTGKKGSSDIWDLNFGALLKGLSLKDTSISGFILYADQTGNEKASSDPYLLLAAGNGMPAVPEPTTYFAGFAAIGFALLFHAKQVLKKRATAR